MTVGNERIEAEAKQLIKQLTPREREILSGVIHGLSNQQIGEALGISARTVEIHRANMIKKLGAKNSAAAVKIALDAGFNDAAPSPNSNGDWIGEAA
jgi:FixJ family two-component response regulator